MASVRRIALWLSVVATWWVFAALVSRAALSGTFWTEISFGAGVALTYVAVWAIVARCSKGSPRRVLLRALATAVTFAVLLVLLELPAMVGLVSYASLLDATAITDAFVADAELSFRRPARFSWTGRVRSDLASSWNVPLGASKLLSFTTDARGFRNRREREQTDVVLIGDSYVEGWYVSDDETAAVVLEQRLGRPVSNLGVSGFGTLQELVVLRQSALPQRPRLVAWFFFEGNDLYDDQEFENTLLYLQDHDVDELGFDLGLDFDWPRFRGASFVRNAYGRLRRTSHPLVHKPVPAHCRYRDAAGASHRLYFHDYAALPFTDYEQERFETTKTAFREGIAVGREEGVAVVLLFVPMKFRVYGEFCSFAPESPYQQWEPWDLPTRFAAFCADGGIECVDLSEPMRQAAATGRLLYAPEDSHWNAEGHAFVAEQVLAVWNRLGLDAQ